MELKLFFLVTIFILIQCIARWSSKFLLLPFNLMSKSASKEGHAFQTSFNVVVLQGKGDERMAQL